MLSFIKKVIQLEDSSLLSFLDSEDVKPFTFALLVSSPKVKNEKIITREYPKFVISTHDVDFALKFYNGFLKVSSGNLEVGGFVKMRFKPTGFKLVVKKIRSEDVLFRTLSPLCVKDRYGRAVLPGEGSREKGIVFDTEVFKSELYYSLTLILGRQRIDVEFSDFEGRKVVVKHFPSDESKASGRPVKLVCWEGLFRARGHPEDLNLVYLAGLGFRRSQGFGCLDVVREF